MIEDDLDENIDESIQHYAHKKRENTNSIGLILAIIIILIVVVALIIIFK
jgi:heme/copper-type cytochrome/quinol oxidase subunit 4